MSPPPTLKATHPPSGLGAVLLATIVALIGKTFLADLAVVDGRSMEPSFTRGSIVLVLRCAYGIRLPGPEGEYWIRWRHPQPGDTVLAFPPDSEKRVIKRVLAVGPTQRGQAEGVSGTEEGRPPLKNIFLIGDNPEESRDSREYGPISADAIAGKVVRLWR